MIDREKPNWPSSITAPQRDWVRNAYSMYSHEVLGIGGLHCFLPIWRGDKQELCGSEENIHIHHVEPKRFRSNRGIYPHPASNLVPICAHHHIGKGYPRNLPLDFHNEYVPIIHPDFAWGLRNYNPKHTPHSIEMVFKARANRVNQGLKYWNEDFDVQLAETARLVIDWYSGNFPNDKYPSY